jgi:hypothetical protein
MVSGGGCLTYVAADDGMALATLIGDNWVPLAQTLPGFRAQPTNSVIHFGTRDIDAPVRERLDRRGIAVVPTTTGASSFSAIASHRRAAVDEL